MKAFFLVFLCVLVGTVAYAAKLEHIEQLLLPEIVARGKDCLDEGEYCQYSGQCCNDGTCANFYCWNP